MLERFRPVKVQLHQIDASMLAPGVLRCLLRFLVAACGVIDSTP